MPAVCAYFVPYSGACRGMGCYVASIDGAVAPLLWKAG